MSKLGPERRRAVLLFAGVAAMSSGPILLKGRPILMGVWLAMMVAMLIVGGMQLRKAKEMGR